MASLRSWAVLASLTACGTTPPADTIAFDLDSSLATGPAFWDLPYPSDLRLTADGRVDFSGFPNRRDLPVVNDLLSTARERAGFPVMPLAYVKFTGLVPDHALDDITPDALVVDIDPASPERGTSYPVVAQTLVTDDYTGKGLVALAPRPGIVLRGRTRYAFVLRQTFAPGVAIPPAFAELAAAGIPAGAHGKAAAELYAPLWPVLDQLAIADPLVATVFTTGDEIAVLHDRSEAIRTTLHATIQDLHVDPIDGAAHDGYCELVATVTFPQFQAGAPPFDSGGRFVLDAAGVPIAQGSLTVPLTITIPNGEMPAGGWPLWQFFHGSGGASFDLVDDGPSLTADDNPIVGEGPGAVVARRGIAAAASALPLDPERLPGAGNYAYLNFNNLSAFPYTFQQGVIEQRLLLDALVGLDIPAATVASCASVAPVTHHFDATKLVAGGHSMGGMYANMIGAVEPRFGALTPFGAGGFWNLMILDTAIIPGSRNLLGSVLGVDGDQLTFVHPALSLIEMGWEIADPATAMARLARRPLPGMRARHVYEPIGLDDKFFPNPVFDAAALAYGNQEAGPMVWPGTQDALRVDHLDGLMTYPVTANRGTTAVVVQYHDDGILDAHYIHRQLDAVKYQYGCFLQTYVRDGVPTVPAPQPVTAPCD